MTAFDSPGPTVPKEIQDVELSLTQDKLVLTMEEVSGSIWLLENVAPQDLADKQSLIGYPEP